LIHKKIKGDVSILSDCSCIECTPENFKKLEITKKENAKKKVLNALQRIHGTQKITD
jgi:hypothetical protein